ncbi:MAG: hypothetical protein ACRDP6_30565 [Actinoallomurus sp.]
MNEIILMSDARVAAVPVRECGESLVDVRRDASLLTGVRPEVDDRGTGRVEGAAGPRSVSASAFHAVLDGLDDPRA